MQNNAIELSFVLFTYCLFYRDLTDLMKILKNIISITSVSFEHYPQVSRSPKSSKPDQTLTCPLRGNWATFCIKLQLVKVCLI